MGTQGKMKVAALALIILYVCAQVASVDVMDASGGEMMAPKMQATEIQEVTASNWYNERSAPQNAVDNNQDTFWSSQLGQSNAFLRVAIADGKPVHHVKSIQVKYYGKRSARLTRIQFRCEKGRTLTLVDE